MEENEGLSRLHARHEARLKAMHEAIEEQAEHLNSNRPSEEERSLEQN